MVKYPPADAGDVRDAGSIRGLGRSPGYLLRCSCLEDLTDSGAWRAAGHGVARHQMQLKRRSVDTHVHTSTGGRMGRFRAQRPQRAKWREAGHTGRLRGSGPIPCLASPGQALPDPPHSCTFHLNSPWTILPPPSPRAPPEHPHPTHLAWSGHSSHPLLVLSA